MQAKSKQRLHKCQNDGGCASKEAEKVADSIDASKAVRYGKSNHQNPSSKVTIESMTFREFMIEGYYTRPPIDRERYPNRDNQGLEGPFSGDNGKVYYYDPKEGKYYDPDSDFYMSQDEYEATQHSPEKRTELMQQQRERDFARRK